ncbi:MAG: histidine kinase [Actinomycetia bacterium]|nr:histidine kinase [Actinomycetes bacterium]
MGAGARRERGGISVVMAVVSVLIVLIGGGAVLATSAAAANARAQAAADLSALAAAGALIEGLRGGGTHDPCAAAARIAHANGASVRSCVMDSAVNVTVAVSVPLGSRMGWWPGGEASAVARAGPAPAQR